MIDFDAIARALARRELHTPPADGRTPASVALILRRDEEGPAILFVERAAHDDDPWSGDIGFPGGKVEATDRSPREAAERETREETGLDLRTARFFGHLTDIVGAHLPVRVACFVYGIETDPSLRLNAELQDAFWVPLTALSEPQRHVVAPVRFGDEPFERPAIRLPVADKPVLWGITYRLVMEFLRLLEVRTMPHEPQRRA